MFTKEDLTNSNSIYKIPKNIHLNKGVLLDYRLFNALVDADKKRDHNYDFDVFLPKYGINLQRPYVWEHYQQNEFIISVLLEKPIDPIIAIEYIADYKNRDNVIIYIIDGKQRLMTIQKFGRNEFPVIINGKEVYYNDFDYDMKMFFQSRVNYLTANVYYSYPDAFVTDDMKIILFNYYNFSGTPQTKEHKDMLEALVEKNCQK